jgi:hypothetical protein
VISVDGVRTRTREQAAVNALPVPVPQANALYALVRKARRRGLSSTDAMRETTRSRAGEPDAAEPAPRVLRDGGSAVDAVSLDRSG